MSQSLLSPEELLDRLSKIGELEDELLKALDELDNELEALVSVGRKYVLHDGRVFQMSDWPNPFCNGYRTLEVAHGVHS